MVLLHRQLSWFTGFAALCKPANLMELLLRAQKVKSPFSPRPLGIASMLAVVAALSACNTNKMFGDVSPGETLNQGYIVDQQTLDLVPVGSSRE